MQYVIDREIEYKGFVLTPQYLYVECWNGTVYMVRAFVKGKRDRVAIMSGAYKMVSEELRKFVRDYNIEII